MKRYLTLALSLSLLFSASLAFAFNPNDFEIMQRNSANNGNNLWGVGIPTSSADGIVGVVGSTTLPGMYMFGTRLSVNHTGNVLNIDLTAQPESNVTNLVTDLAAKSGIFSTLAGYGIADAYPLSGNPSGFLTSVPAQSWTSITGKPTFSTVATTGAYADLSGLPTIPSAQVSSDWNAVSGVSQILNRPTLGTASSQDSTAFATSAQGALADTALQTAPVTSVASKTGAVTLAKADVGLSNVDDTSDAGKPVSTAQAASIATKLTVPTGTNSQYLRGDATTATFPTDLSSFSNGPGYITSAAIPAPLYSTYQASVTQTGTSAPSATQLANSFAGGVTFAWARTSAGTYTVTASSAVFTANKTKVFFGPLNNALGYVSYTVTSTTVITVNTTLTSILSLLLTTANTDALMTATPIDIRVYP